MRKRTFSRIMLVSAALATIAAPAFAQNFTSPTRANVLRQLNDNGTFAVGLSTTGLSRAGSSNDGSGQVAYQIPFTTTVEQTYTLPTDLVVGSYWLQFDDLGVPPPATTFEIQGRLRSTDPFTTLKLLTPPATETGQVSLDTSMRVTQIRWVATPPSGSGQFRLHEIQVFADGTQPIGLAASPTSANNAAMNVLRDSDRVTARLQSDDSVAGWETPGGGGVTPLDNGSYRNNDHFAVNRDLNKRIFAAWDLKASDPTQLNYVHIGNNQDQTSSLPVQIWTSNLANPDEYNDLDWLLQASGPLVGGSGGPGSDSDGTLFKFNSPGKYTHLRVTFFDSSTTDNYGVVEVEAFGFIPEPASLSVVAMAGLGLMRRRRANAR